MKRLLILVMALVMVLSFTACNGDTPAEDTVDDDLPGLPSAEEIAEGVMESVDNASSYQFDMDMTMDMTGEAEGEVIDIDMSMSMVGAIDYNNMQMMMDIDMNMAMPGEDDMEMAMQTYVVDDTMYMMADMAMLGMTEPMWMKSALPEEDWADISGQMNQVDYIAELLDAVEVNLIGSETIDGIDCYVLELIPDVDQLWQLAMQQSDIGGQGMLPSIDDELLSEMFQDFSVKYWVAKDTYLLAKAIIDWTMELTPEAMGYPDEEGVVNMDVSIIMLAYGYNEPVSIVLPPEAEDAEEMPMMGF